MPTQPGGKPGGKPARAGELAGLEADLIGGALDMSARCVSAVMTPLAGVVSLPADIRLDGQVLSALLRSGHSRLPVPSLKGRLSRRIHL